MKKQAVDHAEHGGIGSYAQRQREHRNDGEPGRLAQASHSEPQFLPDHKLVLGRVLTPSGGPGAGAWKSPQQKARATYGPGCPAPNKLILLEFFIIADRRSV